MFSGELQDLGGLIERMRQVGSDEQLVEVKAAVGKLPKSVPETLSAFANGSGGWVLLGLNEQAGFSPAAGFRAKDIREALAGACADKLHPPLRPDIEIVPFEGAEVVLARIDPMIPADKPCYVKERGRYQGSFIRTGDGDRRLSQYEVDRLIEEHRQPRWDEEITGATLADLDGTLVEGLVARQRMLRPRVFGSGDETDVLAKLHALRQDESGIWRPTLAGLLALGQYPQEFFPRLTVTFAAFPGVTKAPVLEGEQRMLDSVTLAGPIPALVKDTVSAVVRNTRMGAVVDGAVRKDVPDYPISAVREAVTNALMHRDYSDLARGSQVQVNLYLDRLEVLNPGGLYGVVTIDRLGGSGISSARNQRLSTLLEDVAYPDGGMVAENRGSGFAVMEHALAQAGMPDPLPRDDIATFSLSLFRSAVRSSGIADPVRQDSTSSANEVIHFIQGSDAEVGAAQIVEATGLSRTAVVNQLNKLLESGRIEATAPPKSPKRRYRHIS
jgi:ATP-dependent DNA helicase RecG